MALNLQTETLERPLTLTSIMPTVRMLPALDKLKLIQILAEDIGQDKDFFPFESSKTYQFPTPYGSYGVAMILMEYLEKEELKG